MEQEMRSLYQQETLERDSYGEANPNFRKPLQWKQQAQPKKDFYLSYHARNEKWAKWIEWELEKAGYSTTSQAWDFHPGANYKLELNNAFQTTKYVIVVLSPAYIQGLGSRSEWINALEMDNILAVRVQAYEVKGLLEQLHPIDLFNMQESEARETLLRSIQREHSKPSTQLAVPRQDESEIGYLRSDNQSTAQLTESVHSHESESRYSQRNIPLFPDNEMSDEGLEHEDVSNRFSFERPPILYDDSYTSFEGDPIFIYSDFCKRDKLVRRIYEKLIGTDTTAIALTGLKGVGKTTLASLIHEYAKKQFSPGKEPFAQAIWLNMDNTVTMFDLAGNLYKALGEPFHNFRQLSSRTQAKSLFETLNSAEQSWLVILDQFDDLLEWQTGNLQQIHRPGIGAWLDELNRQPCRCKVLLISVPRPRPLSVELPRYLKEESIEGLSDEEGVEWLRQQLGPQASDADLLTVVQLCQSHPLALTLLVFLLKEDKQFKNDLATLLKDPNYASFWIGDVAKNILEYIYPKMSKVQRKLLSAFSIYRKFVPLEAAQAVLNDAFSVSEVLDAVKVLLAQHLLQAVEGGRYRLHAIIASYAQKHFKRNEQANQKALLEAHSKAGQYYRGELLWSGDAQFAAEAVWHYCQAEQWEIAYDVLRQESTSASIKHSGGGLTVLLQLFKLLLPLNRWGPTFLDGARIYITMGDFSYALGYKEDTRQFYQDALDIFRAIGERAKEAETLTKLGKVHKDLRERKEAEQCYEQALSIFRSVGDHTREGLTLYDLSDVCRIVGKKVEARTHLLEALTIFARLGDDQARSWVLERLGEVSFELGAQEDARQYFEAALHLFEQTKDRRGEGEALINLGTAYSVLGETEKARQHLERALTVQKDTGNRRLEGVTLSNIGKFSFMLGQTTEAIQYAEKALYIHQEVGDRVGEGITLNNLGAVYNDLGEKEKAIGEKEKATEYKEKAIKYYKQAISILREEGQRWQEGRVLHNMGTLYLEQNEQISYRFALACFLVAQTIFEQVKSPDYAEAQPYIEKLCNKVGKKEYRRLAEEVIPKANQIVEEALQS
jgi:tetratricopeptide (TPR) repeat protein